MPGKRKLPLFRSRSISVPYNPFPNPNYSEYDSLDKGYGDQKTHSEAGFEYTTNKWDEEGCSVKIALLPTDWDTCNSIIAQKLTLHAIQETSRELFNACYEWVSAPMPNPQSRIISRFTEQKIPTSLSQLLVLKHKSSIL